MMKVKRRMRIKKKMNVMRKTMRNVLHLSRPTLMNLKTEKILLFPVPLRLSTMMMMMMLKTHPGLTSLPAVKLVLVP